MVAAFGYDAFGSPLGFDPAAAGTIYLFGGDGVYDAASGLTLHGNGVRARSGFLFLQRDPYAGDRQDPLSLHKYLYAHANPVTYTDPSGYFIESLGIWAYRAGQAASDLGYGCAMVGMAVFVVSAMNYAAASMSLALMGPGSSPSHRFLREVQQVGYEGMGVGLGSMAVGATLMSAGETLKAAGGYLSQLAQWRNTSAQIQATARQIANGHAFDKHVLQRGEFPWIRTRPQFSQHIEGVMRSPTSLTRQLARGRTAYWDDPSRTIVITDPNHADGGTCFQPRDGIRYFLHGIN